MTFPGSRNVHEPMFVPWPKGMQEQDGVFDCETGQPFVPSPPGLQVPSKLERRDSADGTSCWCIEPCQCVASEINSFEPKAVVIDDLTAEVKPMTHTSERELSSMWEMLQSFRSPNDEYFDATLCAAGHDCWMRSPTYNYDVANGASNAALWWKKVRSPLCCCLSGFPIALLPYPPFKLRVDPTKPSPYKLVDGKYLALQVAASGSLGAGFRELTTADVTALDEYMTRCKLGPYRLGRVLAMTNKLADARSEQKKLKLSEDVASFCKGARKELLKLRRIQKNRMAEYHEKFAAVAA